MKTLYISDLDGTLLRSSETTSDYTNAVINKLTEQGMLFSYATARSIMTAKNVAKGIKTNIPLIVFNGTFVINNVTEEIMLANYFDEFVNSVFEDLFCNGIFPVVYSYLDGAEKVSFIESKRTRGMNAFLDKRRGDVRLRSVTTMEELVQGERFYILCIDEPEKLMPFYEKYKDVYHCIYANDIYSGEQWLEIMPKEASKSNAIRQLKEMLGCERLVVFGDGKNDLDMFAIADECYAVQNEVDELKERATAVIGSNDEDGVAKWLAQNYR